MAFNKAVVAGAAGACAWELAARLLIRAGVPLFDIVWLLGTMVPGGNETWKWWAVGMLVHAAVGAIWAIFYAYFFWSTFDWPPALQGLAFSIGPAILAGLVMIPQMGYMHPLVLGGEMPAPGMFGTGFGWGGPAGVFLGHAIYGLTLGSLYTKPVGSAVRRTMALS
ncbi:MAG TPA: hypothetical protein VFD58_28080 [Blastocatellia bacterium]|nr:hypothetical protein [Blastocatellia bacterium]